MLIGDTQMEAYSELSHLPLRVTTHSFPPQSSLFLLPPASPHIFPSAPSLEVDDTRQSPNLFPTVCQLLP
ncbi:hypothetical protein E2C01_067750 [Portunus trituberculatus]|uniref:Uncharacterized protein n=1 Tax=Portunus trituberculatus TaxID=210409 RepID=A0A5B7HQ55_PORTR|nr:hypothetical protein [Portunus trituberculatus]